MPFSHRQLALFSLLLVNFASACFGFASNNVRRDHFKWMRVQTAHFDVYYDKSTERMVPRMAHYLESAWKDVGDIYNYHVPERTPFFFYSNHNEFEQTNIVPIGEGTGGVTEGFKNRFLIFNDGSEEWMRHVIYHEFTHVVQFNIIYGGFWKSARLVLKSPFLALWAMEGSAEHGSGTIDDATGDMVVRDAFANNQLPPLPELQGFAHLKPNQVTLGYKTGDAAIAFLSDEFGDDKPGRLLFAMRDNFDISSALENLLGCDLIRFDFRFHEWLGAKYRDLFRNAQPAAAYGERLTQPRDQLPQFNESPVMSLDGKKLYFFSDQNGPVQVFVRDLETKISRPLIPLEYRSYEYLHTRGRGMSLSRDGRWLAFSGEKKQRDFLYLFDLKKKRLKRIKVPFDELRNPVFSPMADELVCIGMARGYNDLYRIGTDGKIIERLTDSPQDEKDPVYSIDGKNVIFSGEMIAKNDSNPMGWNIFSLNLETKERTEITNDLGSELEPEPLPDGSLIYVRDRNDQNQYGFNFTRRDAHGQETQLTNFIGGGFSPRYASASKNLYFIGFDGGEKHIYKSTWSFEPTFAEASVGKSDSLSIDVGKGELGAPPASNDMAAVAPLLWPADNNSSLFSSAARPYRFKASTDLFLPFFWYSSVDGLVVMDVLQFSEMLGNHQFGQQAQYASKNDMFNISMVYTYARFRPNLSLAFQSTRFFQDINLEEERREVTGIALVSYPFDRITSLSVGMGATNRDIHDFDDGENDENVHDRFAVTSFEYDTVTGRYLMPVKGQRLSLFYQQGFERLAGDQSYRSGGTEMVHYTPLPRQSTIAARLFYGRSVGEERQVFRYAGVDRVRSLPSGNLDFRKSNVLFGNVEARLKLKYLHTRTAFLFPDFFFKASYLLMFYDAGYGWDSTTERKAFQLNKMTSTTGVGISWPTFILQSYQINFTIQWAKRTDKGNDIWYVTIGPSF